MGTPGKQESAGQSMLRNLLELEEPPEAPYDQGLLTYIKKLAAYVSDIAATLLGFVQDAEVSAEVLGKDLDRLRIQTEVAHGSLFQDEKMEREHRTVWGVIWKEMELAQKRAEESIVITLKTQVSNIDSFVKNMES